MACIASSITNVVALKATKVQVSAAAAVPPLSSSRPRPLPSSNNLSLGARTEKLEAALAVANRVCLPRGLSILSVDHATRFASRGAACCTLSTFPSTDRCPGPNNIDSLCPAVSSFSIRASNRRANNTTMLTA